ncbi:MAG: hypothetical protein ACLFQA_10875, partial [Bacteroidales bacterium]
MRKLPVLIVILLIISCNQTLQEKNQARIKPYSGNQFYWQYKGKPILLIGASKDDNLFQIPDLKEHLDEISKAGTNYVRNTMSERLVNGYEVRAFMKTEGKYDLNQWNNEYWQRFSNLLNWAYERDIIVQIEIWATHDFFTREKWDASPWNPDQNVNFSYEDTKLSRKVPEYA